jgi:flagellar hook-length control protein FliK
MNRTAAPVPAAVLVEAQAATAAPEHPAPTQQQPAAATVTPDVAQAIIFAPFAAAQASAPPAAPAAASASPAKDANAKSIETEAPTQCGLFKKTAFTAQTKPESPGSAFAKIAGETLAAPQGQTPARADTGQPGAASPITGFDAPRPATDSLSTPVARALHGAAAMQVAQHVAPRFDGQSANFEVRLDPAELGRVDVKITVDHDKRVTAAVSADSAQTLSDLRGAARDIERALNEAGLDLAQGGLSFDLNQRQTSDEKFDAASHSAADADENGGAETVMIAARPFGMERWSASGVDVWA